MDQNQEASIYVGNLDERIDESLLYELMIQAGPVKSVYMPRDRVTLERQGYGFVEFATEESAAYAANILNHLKVYGHPIKISCAKRDQKHVLEIGACLFVGNLNPLVDEQLLQQTFGAFGTLVAMPKISRDDNGKSNGHGLVTFETFDAADKAIANMNDQLLMSQLCIVEYAYKDSSGNRHGDESERLLAKEAEKNRYKYAVAREKPRKRRRA